VYRDLAQKRKIEMERFSPMTSHHGPSIIKSDMSDMYCLHIIVSQRQVGNNARKHATLFDLLNCFRNSIIDSQKHRNLGL